MLESLRADRLLTLAKGKLKITAAGRERVLEERIRFVNGPPPDPPFLVHIGPIATGKTVRQDPEIFKRLAKFERKVLGVELEAAAIGLVAQRAGIPSIIAKAVSDYGDLDKDDSFRQFACRASAEFLIAFLVRHPPRSLKRNQFVSISSEELKAWPQQIAAVVLNSLLEKGSSLSVPEDSPRNSLFFCEHDGGERGIGTALNNSGLIAYLGSKPLSRVISIDQKRGYEAKHLDIGNNIIHFAELEGPTQGLTPSYLWDQVAIPTDGETLGWSAFDRNGQRVTLELRSFCVTMLIGEAWLQNLLEATGDGDVLGGPVFSMKNEIIGFVVAYPSGENDQRFFYIWPWVSLNNALNEARVLEGPPWKK